MAYRSPDSLKWPTILTVVSMVGTVLLWRWMESARNLGEGLQRMIGLPVLAFLAIIGIPALIILLFRIIKQGIR